MSAYKANLPPKENFWDLQPPAPDKNLDQSLIDAKAQASDIGLITLGRNSGEFADRPLVGDFYLTRDEIDLITKVSAAFHARNKQVVVILNIGNVIETASWRDIPDAIVMPWQGGQEAGNAVVDGLLGEVNPPAKLPTTFPLSYDDTPTKDYFPGVATSDEVLNILGVFKAQPSQVEYREGIYVGYRYYDTAGIQVAYPFGFGLSYTTFSYSDLRLSSTQFDDALEAVVTVTNTGKVAGREVVQLYLSAPASDLD